MKDGLHTGMAQQLFAQLQLSQWRHGTEQLVRFEQQPIMGHVRLLPPRSRRAYRMGMPNSAERWTRDAVLALPDDCRRHELMDRELLVSPSPRRRHQAALAELFRRLPIVIASFGQPRP